MDLTDEREELRGSAREQRVVGVSFLQKALDVLGLGGEVSDNILDLVVKELYECEDYYVGDKVADEVARLDAYDAMLMAPLKFREKKERILQDLKEILLDDPFDDEL